MRHFNKIITLLFIATIASVQFNYAQNLTMNQLVNMRKMDVGGVTNILNQKNWEFIDADEETDDILGNVSFAYQKSVYDDNATSFLSYYFSEELQIKRISIQVNSRLKYNEYLSAIKKFGCKDIGSKVIDGKIYQLYQGATTSFIISNGITQNSYNVNTSYWNFELRDNDDF